MDIYTIDVEKRIGYTHTSIETFLSDPCITTYVNSLVFIHKNNDECDYRQTCSCGSHTSLPLLECSAEKVLRAGGRVIVFSGADMSELASRDDIYIRLKTYLKSVGFAEEHHFAFVPLDSLDKDHPDLLKITEIPDSWRVDRLDKRKQRIPDELLALNILSRLYTALHSSSSPIYSIIPEEKRKDLQKDVTIYNLNVFSDKNKEKVINSDLLFEDCCGRLDQWKDKADIKEAWDMVLKPEAKQIKDPKAIIRAAIAEFDAVFKESKKKVLT